MHPDVDRVVRITSKEPRDRMGLTFESWRCRQQRPIHKSKRCWTARTQTNDRRLRLESYSRAQRCPRGARSGLAAFAAERRMICSGLAAPRLSKSSRNFERVPGQVGVASPSGQA